MLNRLRFLIATAGGVGAIPFAPGTFGAAVAALLYLLVVPFAGTWTQLALAVLLGASSWGTIWIGKWAEDHFGKKDPGSVVIDEVAGLLLTLCLFEIPGSPGLTLLWSFPLTRLFDIVKLPPARRLEKLPHGWGVLLDDLASSVYAVIVLHALRWLFPHWFVST